jgi:hypothetical protein
MLAAVRLGEMHIDKEGGMPILLWYLPAIIFAGMCQVMLTETKYGPEKRAAKRSGRRRQTED